MVRAEGIEIGLGKFASRSKICIYIIINELKNNPLGTICLKIAGLGKNYANNLTIISAFRLPFNQVPEKRS